MNGAMTVNEFCKPGYLFIARQKTMDYFGHKYFRCCSINAKLSKAWKILFFGADDFSLESLKKLHEARLDEKRNLIADLQISTSSKQELPNPVKKYGYENKFIVHPWPWIVEENKFDLGVVVSFGHLIPENIISAFPLGIINVHASILPRWRGAAPIVHAILNGDKETGITIMKINHHFDTGKVLTYKRFPIAEDATSKQLSNQLSTFGANLLLECLENLPEFMKKSYDQDHYGVTKAPKPKEKMAHINWASKQIYIDRQYRAISEYFKLYTKWNNTLVKFDKMVSLNNMDKLNIPSLVDCLSKKDVYYNLGHAYLHRKQNILCIRCEDGWIGFQRISLPGKKMMTARDFYNGFLSKVEIQDQQFSLNVKVKN